jgi:hypothetical protein
MNYLLPLYLDYLERPKIYEHIYLKEAGQLNVPYKTIGKIAKKNMKLQAAHKVNQTAKELASTADTQRRIKDLAALNKKTATTTAKKTAANKLKIAAQQTSQFKPAVKKAVTKSGGSLGTTLKKVGGKAALVAGGAAAAYGGYKLYKRHFSKAAKKCKGKNGAERTLCLQQNTR